MPSGWVCLGSTRYMGQSSTATGLKMDGVFVTHSPLESVMLTAGTGNEAHYSLRWATGVEDKSDAPVPEFGGEELAGHHLKNAQCFGATPVTTRIRTALLMEALWLFAPGLHYQFAQTAAFQDLHANLRQIVAAHETGTVIWSEATSAYRDSLRYRENLQKMMTGKAGKLKGALDFAVKCALQPGFMDSLLCLGFHPNVSVLKNMIDQGLYAAFVSENPMLSTALVR